MKIKLIVDNLSIPTMLVLTETLEGMKQEAKDEVARQIRKIVRSSKTEKEMVDKAKRLLRKM